MSFCSIISLLAWVALLSSPALGDCVTYTTLVTRAVLYTPGVSPSSTLVLDPVAQDSGHLEVSTAAYSETYFTLGNPTSVVTINALDLPSSTLSSASLLVANLSSTSVPSISIRIEETTLVSTPLTTTNSVAPSPTYIPKAQVQDVTSSANGQLSASASTSESNGFLRGVNIGGWLLLEKWMNQDVFAGTSAIDEFTLCQSVPDAASRLQNHWQTYFTEADVKRLKQTGINALRIPIGFWSFDNQDTPYIQGADAYLEKAIVWAQKEGMKVWVDCHGSPGSQNGFDNSGRAGAVDWQKGSNTQRSIDVLKTMAAKYGSQTFADTVVGLELVNEPISWGDNNIATTKQFAADAYMAVKAVAENQNLIVVMHDAFEGAGSWAGFPAQLNSNGRFGVDSHLYQLFTDADNSLTQAQHIAEACSWASGLSSANRVMPTYVGEWTAATNICVNPDGSTVPGTSCSTAGCQCQSADMDSWNADMVAQVRRFVEAQLDVFEQNSSGYFFWSFGGPGGWGFFNGIEKGVIPNPVTSRMYPGQCGSPGKRSSSADLTSNRRAKRGQLGANALE